jgi:hypothetical protein
MIYFYNRTFGVSMDWKSRDRYLREALLEAGFEIKNVKIKEGKKIVIVEKSLPETLKSRRRSLCVPSKQ